MDEKKNYLPLKFYMEDFVLKIPVKLSFCVGFAKTGQNRIISHVSLKGYLYTKRNMREKTQERNDLTFKFYIEDFVLKIPFKLSFCLGFAKIE